MSDIKLNDYELNDQIKSLMAGRAINDPQVIIDVVRHVVSEEVERMVKLITTQCIRYAG